MTKDLSLSEILAAAIFFALVTTSCSPFPRDPKESLSKIKGGELIVGVREGYPWAYDLESGNVKGVEAELIQSLAKKLDAKVVWVKGSADNQLNALMNFEIHLMIGGFTSQNPWKANLGTTRNFYTSNIVIGVPKDSETIRSLEGKKVAVRKGLPYFNKISAMGALPVLVNNYGSTKMPIVAPEWQLKALNYKKTNIPIAKLEHVILTPPGENAWISELEKFLEDNKHEIEEKLVVIGGAL